MSALAAGLALAAALAGAAQEPPPPVFASGVELVHLDVFVSERGRPVTDLAASDFEVRDNGVLQEARLVDQQDAPIDAVLAFDTSASLTGAKLGHLRAAGRAFLDGLSARGRVALLTFSHDVTLMVPPTRDRAAVRAGLEAVQPVGSTALRDALYLAMKLAPRGGRPLVALFTDGQDNLSWLSPQDVLETARRSDVLVYVVASREETQDPLPVDGRRAAWARVQKERAEDVARLSLLREVAKTTGGELWTATADGLPQAFQAVLQDLRTRYVLSYEPRGLARAGRHVLKVSVKGRGLAVRTRTEYTVPR